MFGHPCSTVSCNTRITESLAVAFCDSRYFSGKIGKCAVKFTFLTSRAGTRVSLMHQRGKYQILDCTRLSDHITAMTASSFVGVTVVVRGVVVCLECALVACDRIGLLLACHKMY